MPRALTCLLAAAVRSTHWRFVTATSSYGPYRTKLKKLPRPS